MISFKNFDLICITLSFCAHTMKEEQFEMSILVAKASTGSIFEQQIHTKYFLKDHLKNNV